MEEEVKYLDYEGLILYHLNLLNALNQKANSSDLADVAISGDYNDLTNTPTNVSTFNNDAGYITNEIDNTNGHDFVEIGGLKWATMNVGANNITDIGLYFQWGDNEGYSAEEVGVDKQFTWEDYKFNPSGDGVTFTKYNSTDQKVSLDLEDDPVALLWGSDWRTPTYAELQFLRESVNVSWTNDYEDSGVSGIILTDKTDSEKVLFFPATGLCNTGSIISEEEGFYWSKSLSESSESQGIGIGFNSEDTSWNLNYPRYYGYCVRGILSGPAKRTIMGVTQSEKDIWNSKINDNDLQVALDEYGNAIYYDSTTQKIQLKHGNTVLSEFSAAPFIKDGMVSNVEIKNVTIDEELVKCLVITFNTDSLKQTINIPIADIFNPDNYYTKTQIDSNYYNKSEIDDIVEEIEEGTAQLENYYTKEEVDGIIYIPTIGTPTSSTLTYTKNGELYNFKIGQLARVADADAPLGYKFYLLFDIANGEAKWNACPTKMNPTYTPPTPSLTPPVYTGSPQPILEGGSSGDGNIQYSMDGSNWSSTIPTVTDAGTYTVYWRLQGDGIHSDVPPTAVTVTMLPKEVEDPDITLSISEYTYDGNACTPTVTLKDGDTTIDSSEYIVTYSDNTNAGTATITITNVANSNYVINASTTFTIDKAAGSVTTAPVNRASAYNGSAQPVADAGAGTGTMMYRLGDSGDFSSSIPTVTNAGIYTLYYYAAESANYLQSSTASIEVSIAKIAPVYTAPTAKTLTYTGSALDLLNAGSSSDGTIQYSDDGGTTWSTTIPQGTNAGSYTPQWKLVGDNNHNDVTGTVEVTIAKVTPILTAPTAKSGLTYNESAQNLVNAGSADFGTLQYSSDNENWGTSIPNGTNAGDYSVYYRVVGDSNINNIAAVLISCSIAKASRTMSWVSNPSNSYVSISKTIEASTTGDGSIIYSSSDTTKAIVDGNTVNCIAVGTTTITASVAETTNYLSASINYSLSIIEAVITTTFNVTSTSSDTKIFDARNDKEGIKAVEIDGVVQSDVPNVYRFSSTGNHTVRYTLKFPQLITHYTFYDCANLSSITIPDSVKIIEDYVFCGCTSLTSITIPDSVTSIGTYAFNGCTNLSSITIPDSVTSLGLQAFQNCTSLANVRLSDNLTVVYIYTFQNCTSLPVVDYIRYAGNCACQVTDSSRSTYSIRSGTKYLVNTFYNCQSLSSITIPDSVKIIGQTTFYNCKSLTSITIPNSVTSIESSAFAGCTNLANITIPDSVTNIGAYTFQNCTSLPVVDYVRYAGNCACQVTDNSRSTYSIRSGTKFLANTFNGCKSLTSITIPNSVTNIQGAFYNCTSLANITIPDSVTIIGNNAFYNTSLASITIPNSVTSIGGFQTCKSLTSITIPDSVTSIESFAFNGCTNLTSVTIPNSVTSIGQWAFRDCQSLTSITIPNSVTSIGDQAFLNCTSLTSIIIPDSVILIGESAFEGIYLYIANFTNNSIRSEEIYNYWRAIVYDYEVDGLFIKDNVLVACKSDAESITIPVGVTKINDYVFAYCNVKSVTIPNTVISIGSSAFEESRLTSVTIPDSVTSIGSSAFQYTQLSNGNIVIGSGVTSIGAQAFVGAYDSTVTCYATTPPTLGYYAFSEPNVIYVPSGSVNAYKSATNWSSYANKIQAIP